MKKNTKVEKLQPIQPADIEWKAVAGYEDVRYEKSREGNVMFSSGGKRRVLAAAEPSTVTVRLTQRPPGRDAERYRRPMIDRLRPGC